jgi:hypothetical protein
MNKVESGSCSAGNPLTELTVPIVPGVPSDGYTFPPSCQLLSLRGTYFHNSPFFCRYFYEELSKAQNQMTSIGAVEARPLLGEETCIFMLTTHVRMLAGL